MTTLALGRRQLAAHPPYGPTGGLTCATVYRTHVHVKGGIEPHYYMPDGCAACGRQWFAVGEELTMGFCWDCWPGNTMVLDEIDGFAVGPPDAFPDAVLGEMVAPEQPRGCDLCAAYRAKYGQATAACAAHRKPVYRNVEAMTAMFDDLVTARDSTARCTWCGHFGAHALDCPYGPVMQYVRRSGH